jgi:chitinase
MGVFQRVTSLVMVLGLSVSGVVGVSSSASADEARVIAPYYAGWEQGNLAPGALPWEAMSHVIHFSVLPTASGGLDDATNGVSASRARALVSEARKHDTKVLISVGGTPGSEHWPAAASATNRARFVDNLVELMASRGYDGIDLNWEGNVDQADYLAVMRQLREALDARGNGELLTAAFYGSWNTLAARAHPLLDWVSMMTYLPYGQPANSHNSPLHGSQYARIDNLVSSWLAAGVPADKIVPGVATYASEWRNDQLVTPEMPYRTAVAKGYTSGLAWDATARASAWRSATTFVSIEDDRAIKAKADYLDTQGLRGLIVWELGTGRHNGTIPVMDSIRTHLPLTTTPNVAPAGRFRDVSTGVHAGAIERMAAGGVISGYPDATFRPTNRVTRGQVASMLTRSLDLDPRSCTTVCARLSDVAGSTHAEAIHAAVGAGIVNGYGDGTFRPDRPVTRGQLASMLATAFEVLDDEVAHPFIDVAGTTHETSIAAITSAGLASGQTPSTFAPNADVRRDQMATFLDRALAG